MARKKAEKTGSGEVMVQVVGQRVNKQYAEIRADAEKQSGEVIPWPYDPQKMYKIFESSSLLQPNIGAYIANIDQLGYYFEPVVPLGTDTDDAVLRGVIFEEDVIDEGGKYSSPDVIPDSVVDVLRAELAAKQLRDRVIAESFLRTCSMAVPFLRLRAEVRQDIEVTGNGFWEVLRDAAGRVRRFVRILPSNIEVCVLSDKPWPCREWARKTRRKVVQETIERRIRRYKVQAGAGVTYLKEFGCMAVVSSSTGQIFADRDEYGKWKIENSIEEVAPANEVIHFRGMTNLSDPYGIPRWVGAFKEVVGTAAVAEYNNALFSEGLMLPLLIMVSGGTFSPESVARLRVYLEGLKGVENAHRAAVLEATSKTGGAVPTVEVKELNGMTKDGGFLEYDKRNEDRVGSQFRISDIVRGNTTTVANRATAEAALVQADTQVFAPIRAEFDWMFSNLILTEIGVTSVEFVSRGVTNMDAELIGKMAVEGVRNSILTPNEAREILEVVFEREFPQIEETWATVPPEVYRAELLGAPAGQPKGGDSPSLPEEARTSGGLMEEITELLERGRAVATAYLGAEASRAVEEGADQ